MWYLITLVIGAVIGFFLAVLIVGSRQAEDIETKILEQFNKNKEGK